MSRPVVSFGTIAAAEADIERVATEIRRAVAEIDRDIVPLMSGLNHDEIERLQAARGRRDAAAADLCTVLAKLGTALAAARDAGLPQAYARPGWS